MIDLDAIQVRADRALNEDHETNAYVVAFRWHDSAKDVPALVAELRVARQVIGPARAIYEDGSYDPVLFAELGVALDKVTGGK